jgi:spoIIIJ-associated protein
MTELADIAAQKTSELVAFFGINADVTWSETEDGVTLNIEAPQASARLIGHHGETLRALEYLVNQMMKRIDEHSPRLLLDVAGYRESRRRALEELAQEAAARVRESGQEEELRPMNPAERRIVHMALRELDGIETESRGEDRSRRIVVKPAK